MWSEEDRQLGGLREMWEVREDGCCQQQEATAGQHSRPSPARCHVTHFRGVTRFMAWPAERRHGVREEDKDPPCPQSESATRCAPIMDGNGRREQTAQKRRQGGPTAPGSSKTREKMNNTRQYTRRNRHKTKQERRPRDAGPTHTTPHSAHHPPPRHQHTQLHHACRPPPQPPSHTSHASRPSPTRSTCPP